jgi:hypothetical protein
VRYELLLQPSASDQPFDLKRVEEALAARGVSAPDPVGLRRWTLADGEVEVEAVLEAGQPVALAVKIPLSDKLELLSEGLKAAGGLAEACTLKLVDPQLSRVVGEKDEGAVTEQFQRTARYAGEMVGLPEAVSASFQPEAQGIKPMTKVLFGLGALFLLLYWAVDAIGRRL